MGENSLCARRYKEYIVHETKKKIQDEEKLMDEPLQMRKKIELVVR